MDDTPGIMIKKDKKKEKEREIIIRIHFEEEPENPYDNLGVIGESMWKWKKYFTGGKREKKENTSKLSRNNT